VLKVQVTSPEGGKLVLFRDGRPWGDPIPLPTSPNVTITRKLPMDAAGYVRAEVRGAKHGGHDIAVLSNPIYWTRQVTTVTPTISGSRLQVAYTAPQGAGAAVFLSTGAAPYGASDPTIVARAYATGESAGTLELEVPGPGRYTVSVFPLASTGELLNYRLPATASVEVPAAQERISTRDDGIDDAVAPR
jgi:hypothetical protein